MDGGLWHCTGGSDQDHPQEKEMQKGKMVVWQGLTYSWEKKRNEKQSSKEKISPGEGNGNPFQYSCLKNSMDRGAWWATVHGVERVGHDWATNTRAGYIQRNAEFQRIARRSKKAFLTEQCKEREENNRIRKTRDLFKKIRDTKGTFHAKMGTIKDRNRSKRD